MSVWSPPHGLLIIGGLIACIALASISVRRETGITTLLRVFAPAGALLIGTVFLAEFEFPFPRWHVSQERPRIVYVLYLGLGAILAIAAKRSVRRRWGATATAAAFIGMRGLVHLLLGALGQQHRPAPSNWLLLPIVVAVAVDVLVWLRCNRAGHIAARSRAP